MSRTPFPTDFDDAERTDSILGEIVRSETMSNKRARKLLALPMQNDVKDGGEDAQSTPGIGENNKGRAILENMGWTPGTGLGSLSNRTTVKPPSPTLGRDSNKAGLGLKD